MISCDFSEHGKHNGAFLLLGNVVSHSFSLPRTPGGRYKELGCLCPGLKSSSEGPSVAQAQGTPFTLKTGIPWKDSTVWQCYYYWRFFVVVLLILDNVLIKCLMLVCFVSYLRFFFSPKAEWGEIKKDACDESSWYKTGF